METKKSNKIQENSTQAILYRYPKEKSDFIKLLNSCDPCSFSKSNLSSNNFSNSNNNSSPQITNKYFSNCYNQYIQAINKTINEQKKGNSFLEKKAKIYFKVKNNCNKNTENLKSNINNISHNNKIIFNIENSNSHESTFSEKSDDQIRQLEKTLHKKEKQKFFRTINYNLLQSPKEESKNEGRWSCSERIKFIKAYVKFGKNYKLSQKYIGSRSRIQIRSHAQKFFRKLKLLKNNNFDFSDDNLKNLSDIFKLIEAKNKTNIDKKEYLINTLISLSENFPKNGDNLLNNDLKRIKENGEKLDKTIKYTSLNNEKDIKSGNYDEPSKKINNNEDKMLVFENDKINNDLINSNLNLKVDAINQKELYLEERNVYKSIDIVHNEKKPKCDIFMNEKNNCSSNFNIDDNLNINIKLADDDFIYSAGDYDLFV